MLGVDYVCFGNHENDIPLDELRLRIAEFKGKWINSNMPDWTPALPEYAVFDITSGGKCKKIGLLGLNTIDKNLYQQGAFGGAMATALPVIDTARNLRKKLVEQLGCDLVIPMTHQVIPSTLHPTPYTPYTRRPTPWRDPTPCAIHPMP